MNDSVLLRALELSATLGVGTVFGGMILYWLLHKFSKKFDENSAVMLMVVRSMNTLSTQHLLHEATVHGVNESTGDTQDKRTEALFRKIKQIEDETHQRNQEIDKVLTMLTTGKK